MQILVPCIDCLNQGSFDQNLDMVVLTYYSERSVTARCRNGHEITIVLRAQLFEILIESGANALLSGFTLEAAVSFATGLERLYEFAIKVFCEHLQMPKSIYEEMFKHVTRQSERQLGAFLFLYAVVTKSSYALDEKRITERNKFVHRGEIPSPLVAKSFCKKIFEEAGTLVDILNRQCFKSVQRVIADEVESRRKTAPSSRMTAGGPPFFSISTQNRGTFEQNLKALEGTRRLIAERQGSSRSQQISSYV